jgi:hypothetical protein
MAIRPNAISSRTPCTHSIPLRFGMQFNMNKTMQQWELERAALQNRFGRIIVWSLGISVTIFLVAYLLQAF